jgi:hypothetical protein
MGSLWIMVAGPYTAGGADAARRAENLALLNRAAVALFERGHVPIIGVNMALPMIEAAGASRYHEIMMPISLARRRRGGRPPGARRQAGLSLSRRRPAGSPVQSSSG